MKLIRVVVVVSMALALLACAPRPSTAAETIRIGFLGPLTGIFAQAGKDMLDGLKLSLEQIGYQAGGRKIELFEEDTEGNSTTAIAKYRKLVSHDKIHAVLTEQTALVVSRYALLSYVWHRRVFELDTKRRFIKRLQ